MFCQDHEHEMLMNSGIDQAIFQAYAESVRRWCPDATFEQIVAWFLQSTKTQTPAPKNVKPKRAVGRPRGKRSLQAKVKKQVSSQPMYLALQKRI